MKGEGGNVSGVITDNFSKLSLPPHSLSSSYIAYQHTYPSTNMASLSGRSTLPCQSCAVTADNLSTDEKRSLEPSEYAHLAALELRLDTQGQTYDEATKQVDATQTVRADAMTTVMDKRKQSCPVCSVSLATHHVVHC